MGPNLNNNEKEQRNPPNDLHLTNRLNSGFKQQDILGPVEVPAL